MIDGNDAYNAFIAPIISRYGYMEGGVAMGGGTVGGGSTINDQDFFRDGWEVSYDRFFGNHEVHVVTNQTTVSIAVITYKRRDRIDRCG